MVSSIETSRQVPRSWATVGTGVAVCASEQTASSRIDRKTFIEILCLNRNFLFALENGTIVHPFHPSRHRTTARLGVSKFEVVAHRVLAVSGRSEERRVGKECRSRW